MERRERMDGINEKRWRRDVVAHDLPSGGSKHTGNGGLIN
jgi:hypothetical protein